MKKAKKFTIIGSVQGVGFRYFTYHHAKRIGIYGYVRNLINGNVEVYAIGSEEQLLILKEKLSSGPNFSRVENVIVEDMQVNNNYKMFEIK
jgi:acylphosphatase